MEDIIYSTDDVHITNKRVTVGGVTYPTKIIESVEAITSERRFMWLIPFVVTIISFVASFWYGAYFVAMGVLLAIITAVVYFFFNKTYHVRLAIDSGERDIFSSRDRDYTSTVVAQIKEALKSR